MATFFHKIYPLRSRGPLHAISRFSTSQNEALGQRSRHLGRRSLSSTPGPQDEPLSLIRNERDANIVETETDTIDLMQTSIWEGNVRVHGDFDVPNEEYLNFEGLEGPQLGFNHLDGNIKPEAFADLPLVRLPKDIDEETVESARLALDRAFRDGSAPAIVEAAVRLATISEASIASLPPEIFTLLLQRFDPTALVKRYAAMQHEFSPGLAKIMGVPPVGRSGLQYYAATFMAYLRIMKRAWTSDGNNLSLEDYKHLLRCAREVGDIDGSKEMWSEMSRDGLIPDLDCYNQFLATLAWAELLNNDQRQKVMVTRRNLSLRMFTRRPKAFERAFEGHRVGAGGVREQTTQIFDEMIQNEILGNEETFCCLMVAMAREGDITGAEAILRKVWNIDAARLKNPGIRQHEPLAVTQHQPDSPFFPSQRLLFSVAHIYGINNSMSQAVQLVDFIATQYSLTISEEVWSELVERAATLSTRFHGRFNLSPVSGHGHLSPVAFHRLWATMTKEPYNVKPTMFMWDKLINNMIGWKQYGPVQEAIRKTKSLYTASRSEYYKAKRLYETAPPAKKLELAREVQYRYFVKAKHEKYLQYWIGLWLKRISRNAPYDIHTRAVIQDIPKIIEEYKYHLPNFIRYRTSTGIVSFGKWQIFEHAHEGHWKLKRDRLKYDMWDKEYEGSLGPRAQGWVGDDDDDDDWF